MMKLLSRTFATLLLLAAIPHAVAQAVSNVAGKIDEFEIDEGYMVVDGKRLVISGDGIVITYKGRDIEPVYVMPGFSVFYSTRADGSVSELTLIGPSAELDAIDQH